MARILIVGGGCRGRRFAADMVQRGHAVRATTRSEARRDEVEATGAECWIGTPDRLATLRGSLHNVTILCWMLAGAHGQAEQVAALHGSRLEFFLGQAIDTTARGLIYDAWPVAAPVSARVPPPAASATPPGSSAAVSAAGEGEARVTPQMLAAGRAIFETLTRLNSMPAIVLEGQAVSDDGGDAVPGEGGMAASGEDGEVASEEAGGAGDSPKRWLLAACAAVDSLLGTGR